jgi:hypothetical protein
MAAKTIHQYQLRMQAGAQPLDVPLGATVVHVASLGGVIGLWAAGDPDAITQGRTFRIYGNDEEIADGDEYLGSTQGQGRSFHVFVEPVA